MAQAKKSALNGIEKLTLLIYTALALGSLVFRNRDIFFGVLAGGAFIFLNVRALRWIIEKALKNPEKPKAGYFFLLVPKFILIGVVIWVVVKSHWFDVIAFAVGTTSLFLAALAGAVFPGLSGDAEENPADDDGEENGEGKPVPPEKDPGSETGK